MRKVILIFIVCVLCMSMVACRSTPETTTNTSTASLSSDENSLSVHDSSWVLGVIMITTLVGLVIILIVRAALRGKRSNEDGSINRGSYERSCSAKSSTGTGFNWRDAVDKEFGMQRGQEEPKNVASNPAVMRKTTGNGQNTDQEQRGQCMADLFDVTKPEGFFNPGNPLSPISPIYIGKPPGEL